jgi:hypothetical protein
VVDGVIGGYPCQPFSHAGQRRGQEDARHLWPAIARLVRAVAPAYGPVATGLPRWPPGPADHAGWAWVLERWPDLAPAVADTGYAGQRRTQEPAGESGTGPSGDDCGAGGSDVADAGRTGDE